MPISKSSESRAARKHIRQLVALGCIDAAEAKQLRKEFLATLKPAKAEVPAKSAAPKSKTAKPAAKKSKKQEPADTTILAEFFPAVVKKAS